MQLKKSQNYAILPFDTERIGSRFLISNYLGSWALLTKKEFNRLHRFETEDSALREKLFNRGLAISKENIPRLINEFRQANNNLFTDASLHIVVVTNRCNLSCRYCQTKNSNSVDMDKKTAEKVLAFMEEVRSPFINLEFQGGEPLLNWDAIKFFIKKGRRPESTKNIFISLVTNGTLLTPERIEFLARHKVGICISLDGPEFIHNKNRIFNRGKGSYNKVVLAIRRAKNIYDKRGLTVHLLPTITRYNLKYPKETVDEYVKWGIKIISLRPVNNLGVARLSWQKVGYTPREFNRFWAKAMDYIIQLNKKGVNIKERTAIILLKKILKKEDPNFVDLMCPCGAGRKVITYLPNGDIYPCDEARMLKDDIFKLGNVAEGVHYEDVIKKPELFSMLTASLTEFSDYNTAFSPWLGTCPVINYHLQKNIIPKITETPLYQIYSFQLKYLFKKIAEDRKYENIFWKWVDNKREGKDEKNS